MSFVMLLTLFLTFATALLPSSAVAMSAEEMDKRVYGSELYDKYRKVTYWGRVSLRIYDYHYGSGDAKYLKLVAKDNSQGYKREQPRQEIQEHFLKEFQRFFGDLPFHDLDEGNRERLEKFVREAGGRIPVSDEVYDRFWATERARWRALYGGRPGAIYCQVRVKMRNFPVLYTIKCAMSAEENLRYSSWREKQDIGFSSPEYIAGEIKVALTDMLEKLCNEWVKINKYGKRFRPSPKILGGAMWPDSCRSSKGP